MTPEIVEGLVRAFLQKNFDNPCEIPDCHRDWWNMCCSDYRYVAIAAPRSFAKSTSVTHSYTLANILFRERSFILIVADTEGQAALFLDDIKKEIQTNDDLIKTFELGYDGKVLAKDSVTDIIINFRDGHQARVMAKGSGQGLRGVKWDNRRPDLIVCDDLENDELVLNKERRQAFRRWFSGTLIPCMSTNGVIRVVGTILHTDSQLNRLMPRLGRKDQPCEITDLKEVAHPKQIWHSARYRAHDRKMTLSLWPAYKPITKLMEDRQQFLDQGLADVWAQEMLNVPFDEETAPFKRKDFHEMSQEDREQNFHYYISTDFATTDKQKTDYCAFIVSGVNSKGIVHIVHVIRERMESPEILDTLFQLVAKYNPLLVFVESGQIWNALRPLVINAMMENANLSFLYEELPSITDKRSRSAAIRARMRIGAVKFDKSTSWWPDFEEECLRFTGTGSTHDDQVDALSLLGLALQKFVEAPTPQEEEEEMYQQEMEESGMYLYGRSSTTGY